MYKQLTSLVGTQRDSQQLGSPTVTLLWEQRLTDYRQLGPHVGCHCCNQTTSGVLPLATYRQNNNSNNNNKTPETKAGGKEKVIFY